MSRDRYHYSVANSQTRTPMQRAIVALLVVTGVTLLVLAKSQHPAMTKLRLQMLEMLRPAMGAISQPVNATKKLASSTGAVLNTAEENRLLKAENENLRHWQSVALALKAENEALRALTGYQPVAQVSYVTGRVIGQSPATFGQFLTLNAGGEQGIEPFEPVVDAFGLVGRALEVAPNTTRVMLLSDVGSRVPVMTGTTRQRAILSGTGGELLRLSFMAEDATITLGEQVVTTQEGDLIPGGIAVGTVFKKDDSGYLVKPMRPLAQAEYLRVIAAHTAPKPTPAPATQLGVPTL